VKYTSVSLCRLAPNFRVCAGRRLSENMVWIATASLLASFKFEPAKEENGKEIDINYAGSPLPGLVM